MDRGVIVGGVLICASFLLAVLLNRSAEMPTRSAPAAEPVKLDVRCSEDPAAARTDERVQGDLAEVPAIGANAPNPAIEC